MRADFHQMLLAFHHVHKADRHRNDQRRAQPRLNFLGDGQQGGGGVAYRQHRAGVFARSLVHGSDRPCCAAGFGGCRHLRVCHKAERLPAQLGKPRLGDARQRHIGVGHKGAAAHRLYARRHRAGGKAECFGVIEIRRSMDDPLDDCCVFGQWGQPARVQLGGDDFHAGALNVSGQMMLRCHSDPSLDVGKPMAAYTAGRSSAVRTLSASRSNCCAR